MKEQDLNEQQASFYMDLFHVYEENNGQIFEETNMGSFEPKEELLEVIAHHIK